MVQAHSDSPDQLIVTVGLFVTGSAFPSWAAAHLAQMVPGLTQVGFGGGRRRTVHISAQIIIATSHHLGPQKVVFWKGNGIPKISGKTTVGEIYKNRVLTWPKFGIFL